MTRRRTTAPPESAALPTHATPPTTREAGDGQVEQSTRAALVLRERGCELHHADWRALAAVAREAGGVDAVIVDAPYSERTHAGHNGVTEAANERPAARDGASRRGLHYAAWTPADVDTFVETWAPMTRGWIVSLTDDVLALAWREAMERSGMLAFQTVPVVIRGMTVRLTGDGPSSWGISCMVARQRSAEMVRWGTLSGAYVGIPETVAIGGKPTWLMRALVRDYTRPGDLVADPCCGAGTLGVACIAEGRRALLGDLDAAHVEIARKRLLSCPGEQRRLSLDVDAPRMTQASLLEGTGT